MTGIAPPPVPPELPAGAEAPPRWPAWYSAAAFLSALVVTALVVAIAAAVFAALGGDTDGPTPGLTLFGTLVQDAAFIASGLAFASLKTRPRLWHFGLRRAPLWRTIGWTVVAIVAFYAVAAAYTALAEPTGEQTVVEDLGADRGGLLLLGGVVLVVGVAPVVEEFFFRGFFYGALRTRYGVWLAALLNGLLFGAIHYSGPDTLSILPPLAFLGIAFCLLYERTGTLYAPIAFHALNNTIAFSVQVEGDGRLLAIAVGTATIGGCALAGRAQRRRAPLPFGTRGWAGTP